MLVKTGRTWSDVDYRSLRVTAHAQRFLKAGRVPRDARQVDTTWQYVNVKGGPDRRFKNNRRLPVMEYGRVEMTSPPGLRWEIDCSQTAAGHWARKIFAARS